MSYESLHIPHPIYILQKIIIISNLQIFSINRNSTRTQIGASGCQVFSTHWEITTAFAGSSTKNPGMQAKAIVVAPVV